MARQHHPSRVRRSRGTSLLEALVAMLLLTLGALALAKIQVQAWQYVDVTRHRAQALQLAQSELEGLRVAPTFGPATRDHDAVDSDGTAYLLERRVEHDVAPGAHGVTVEVTWSERDGTVHAAVLHTVLAEAESAHSGALVLAGRSGG